MMETRETGFEAVEGADEAVFEATSFSELATDSSFSFALPLRTRFDFDSFSFSLSLSSFEDLCPWCECRGLRSDLPERDDALVEIEFDESCPTTWSPTATVSSVWMERSLDFVEPRLDLVEERRERREPVDEEDSFSVDDAVVVPLLLETAVTVLETDDCIEMGAVADAVGVAVLVCLCDAGLPLLVRLLTRRVRPDGALADALRSMASAGSKAAWVEAKLCTNEFAAVEVATTVARSDDDP